MKSPFKNREEAEKFLNRITNKAISDSDFKKRIIEAGTGINSDDPNSDEKAMRSLLRLSEWVDEEDDDTDTWRKV